MDIFTTVLDTSTSTQRQSVAQFFPHGSTVPNRIVDVSPFSIPLSIPNKTHFLGRISSTTSI